MNIGREKEEKERLTGGIKCPEAVFENGGMTGPWKPRKELSVKTGMMPAPQESAIK